MGECHFAVRGNDSLLSSQGERFIIYCSDFTSQSEIIEDVSFIIIRNEVLRITSLIPEFDSNLELV